MKLSKKSIQKAKIELIDFSNCELSTKSYEESSMKKNAIIFKDEKYLLKYMEKNKAKHYQDIKNQKETYFNSVYSEYISCHIGKMIGLDIQDTIIGFEKENNKLKGIQYIPCVACKDFCKSGENIVNFERIFEIVNRKENKRYNDENFGIIENEKDKTYRIAPIFDCASSLHPKANRKRIKFLANSYERDSQVLYEYALSPNSYFKNDDGIKINYFDFLVNNGFDYNSDIAKSIVKIVPKLIELNNNGGIYDILDKLDGMIIPERIEVITKELNLKVDEMFIPTLEISKELLNKEIDKFMLKDYSGFNKYNNEEKIEFLSEIKNILEMQKLLIENNSNNFDTKDLYQRVDDFFKSKNTKDMKAVFVYLEKNNFPIDYINHFEEKFRLEIEKSTENKEKSNNSKEINEDEEKEKEKEFDINF